MGNSGKILRTFIFKIRELPLVEDFVTFQRRAIVQGKSPGELLSEIIKDYLKGAPALKFTPVTENMLLDALQKKGLSTTKMTIRKWRDLGYLGGTYGKDKFWFTDGCSIIYNLEGMIDFISKRREDPGFKVLPGAVLKPSK